MFWQSHRPSREKECTAPDFVWFNKRAASARVTNTRDLAFYKKETESSTPRYGDSFKNTPRKVIPSDVVSGFAYGKKVRPSTPIDEVISHRFAEAAEDELRKYYTELRDDQENGASQVRKIHLTNAAQGHALNGKKAYHQEETREDRGNFKIKKYQNVNCKVDNGRNNARRNSANAILAQLGKEKEGVSAQASDCPDQLDHEQFILGAYDTM